MSRATYAYYFDVRPERQSDFVEWARSKGVPYWLSQPGLLSYRTYRVQAGASSSLAMAEFESAEALGRLFDTPEWTAILAEFQSYVSNLQSWVLGTGATGEDPIRRAG